MASTAYAPPAFKSIAELVGARAHTTLIGQAPGPHGTSVRPRDTGLEASAAGHAGEGMATTSSRWGEASVRVLLTHPELHQRPIRPINWIGTRPAHLWLGLRRAGPH